MIVYKPCCLHMSIEVVSQEPKPSFLHVLTPLHRFWVVIGISFNDLKLFTIGFCSGKTITYNYRNYQIPFELR